MNAGDTDSVGEGQGERREEPLYQRVKKEMVRSFRGLEVGARLPTEAEYVREYGVSITTVRQAMQTLEQEGWVERQQGRGTFLLDMFAQKRRHVGILLEADISDEELSPVYVKMLQELRLAFLKHKIATRPYLGYLRLGVEIGELTCREFYDELQKNTIAGVVPIFAKRHASWGKELEKRGIPIVGPSSASDVKVSTDYEGVVRRVLAYFRERGHTRMAILAKDGPGESSLHFLEIFQRHASDYGVRIAEENIYKNISGIDPVEAKRAIEKMWTKSPCRPDCIFIESDMILESCIATIKKLEGSVETGVGNWGSDAVKIAPRPRLIRCFVSTRTLAQICADHMKKCLEYQDVPRRITIPFVAARGMEWEAEKEMTAPSDICL